MSAGGIGNQETESRLLPEGSGVGLGRLPGVTGAACAESIRGESWETQGHPPFRGGNCSSGIGKCPLGVGAAHSSHDGKDNITLHERRGRTFAAFLKEGKAGRVLFGGSICP